MKLPLIFFGVILSGSLISCRQVRFDSLESDSQASLTLPESPIEIPAELPDVPSISQPIQKTGSCVRNQKISSCLSCDFEVPSEPKPVLSKAKKLAKIMAMACQIPNKSYPNPYKAPTADQISNNVAACTEEYYPETPVSEKQLQTLNRLLDENDEGLRQKLFKGLWYHPPYSDHFELYFGITVDEVANNFCMERRGLGPVLLTSEYAKAAQGAFFDGWLNDRKAQARWNAAQAIRQQLLTCLFEPELPRIGKPVPPVAKPKCSWKSFEGSLAAGGYKEILQLLKHGYKLSLENRNSCEQITRLEQIRDQQDEIRIVGYKCD